MKKKLVLGLVLLLLFGVWIRINRKELIKVCVIGDFSLSKTTSSVDVFRGVELAIEELNREEIIYDLSRLNADSYENNEMLKRDIIAGQYDIILGPETSSRFLKYQEALTDLDIPVFLIAVSLDSINNKDDNFFRLASSIEDQTKRIVTVLDEQIGASKLDVFYTEDNIKFSKVLATSVQTSWEESGNTSTLFEVGDIEDKKVQEQLKKEEISDVILIIAGPGQAGIIAQLVIKSNPNATVLFPSWAFSDRTKEYIANLPNEFYALSIPQPKKRERYDLFGQSLYTSKGVQANVFSIYGYESAYLMDFAIRNTNSTELINIKEFIYSMEIYNGQFNDFEMLDMGDGSRGYSLYKIEDGEYKILIEKLK